MKPIADKFLPIFERTQGREGHVSIQGDPINDEDAGKHNPRAKSWMDKVKDFFAG